MEDFLYLNRNRNVNYKEHIKRNLTLAIPVMITQAGQIIVNLVDNIMVGGLGGKYDYIVDETLGKTALGAVSLGNAVFITALVVAFGFSFAISPLVAAADAKKDKVGAGKIFSHGMVLNLILAIVLLGALELAKPILYYMGQPEDVIDMTMPYLSIMAWSMIPIMIFQTFRQFSEGLSLTLPVTAATIVGNIVNIALNYGWIYGYWGFPRLEVEGAGLGTFFSRVSMMLTLILVLWSYKKTKAYLSVIQFKKFESAIYKKILNMGIPTALTSFFEVSAFAAAAFICGYAFSQEAAELQLAKTNLAAHQIAISLASTTFMMCMGLNVAATVRVGYQLGLKNYTVLREAGWSSIIMVAIFMILCGILMIVFRFELPVVYLDNQPVIDLAAQLLIIASLFQLSDGIQLVALGSLRGMQDVKIPSIISFVAYWVIAMPLGVILAIYFEMRAYGMWIALFVGLTIAAILLLLRYHLQTKKLIYGNTQISDSRQL
ncbi:MATE family efflux transporter [Moheibacter sp. BDHS18]|uniref:Multidrug-efflux transporter n=1 Tax=Moheibacter lacus TaxID=2745851 RepID=A0A838ZTV7_9FLAO|nr:MATE family efflux transporter [Moheibacter lacus]